MSGDSSNLVQLAVYVQKEKATLKAPLAPFYIYIYLQHTVHISMIIIVAVILQ